MRFRYVRFRAVTIGSGRPVLACDTILEIGMKPFTICAISIAALLQSLVAQAPASKEPKEPTEKEEEELDSGIPITNELVRKTCSPCHKVDDKLRLSRISWRRTTPEGWEQTIKRMISLNGLKMEPAEAREILRYLSNQLGLAPEEARPAAFEVEKRMIDYKYTANKDAEEVCIKCHSMGRVISQRRSKTEWELLIAMHRGYYPLCDFQASPRGGPPQTEPGRDGRAPHTRHPLDKVVPHLTDALASQTA